MDMNTGHETATNMENDKSQGSMHRHGQRGHHCRRLSGQTAAQDQTQGAGTEGARGKGPGCRRHGQGRGQCEHHDQKRDRHQGQGARSCQNEALPQEAAPVSSEEEKPIE